MKGTIDQRARETLPRLGHVRRDEDIRQVEADVDADGAAHHCREYKGPVVPAERDDGEEYR